MIDKLRIVEAGGGVELSQEGGERVGVVVVSSGCSSRGRQREGVIRIKRRPIGFFH